MENQQPAEPEAEKIVDALNAVFGRQVRNRAVHAKGIVAQGIFTPSAGAAAICRAPHFQGVTPVTARLSSASGNRATADTDPTNGPRGLAVKFHLPGGKDTDVVTHSFNGFPVSTGEEFRRLLEALAASGAEVPHPNPAERFFAEHPRARAYFEAPKPPPVSFVTLRYFGVNAFRLSDAGGRATLGRYRFEPVAGEQLLTAAQAVAADGDYLRKELRGRLSQGPARFLFLLQLAGPGDGAGDPSLPWPESRPLVTLGTLELRQLAAEDEEEKLLFSPSVDVAGIEAADPMIQVRGDAYDVSYQRRHR